MSYILEALKKSEQDRKRGDVPTLQTLHSARPTPPETRRWPYMVIVFLLVSLAFVIGWMQPWATRERVAQLQEAPQRAEDTAVVQLESPRIEQQIPKADVALTEIATAQPVPETARVMPASEPLEPVFGPSSPDSSQTPSLDIGAVPHLSEMPRLVQEAIPQMSFAGHVYSTNAEQRSVIINGHSMSEGDRVIAGLRVEQITRDGIIFNYRDQLFRMEILQDWSFDY